MDGGHQTLNDTELVVDDLGEGSETVGCAGCVGDLSNINMRVRYFVMREYRKSTDDCVRGVVLIEIDTDDVHGCIS